MLTAAIIFLILGILFPSFPDGQVYTQVLIAIAFFAISVVFGIFATRQQWNSRAKRLVSMMVTSLGILMILICLVGLPKAHDRQTRFNNTAQAMAGQPIVRAIEEFRKQTGSFPSSLTDLAPKYLPTVPDRPDESQHKFIGWEYRMVTNGVAVTYTLRYYMGRGGIEYEPPVWYGNDEGHRTVLLRNN
jgi:hypothetical protein